MAEFSIRTMRRAYKFRLYPSKALMVAFESTLRACCDLYNCALEERITAWKRAKKSINFYDQQRQLPDVRREIPEIGGMYSRVDVDVLMRLDRTYKAFFRRIKAGKKGGFPRFKSVRRYDSFTYASTGWKADERGITLSKIGRVRWRPWREIPEDIRTVTIKREADGWYAVLSCVVPKPEPLPETGRTVGVDLGMKNLVATSDGEIVKAPKILKKHERALKRTQRIVARRKKGSNRRRKAARALAKKHQRVARARKAFLDKVTLDLMRDNDTIAVENLDIEKMGRMGGGGKQGRRFRRSFRDSAWSTFLFMLAYKAESAGRRVVHVDPRGTSQACSGCGAIVPKTLRMRMHFCPSCGLVLDRDVNAAKNIRQRALSVLRGEVALVAS